jgi:putative ABC transport system substrate-binding protein
MKRREFITLFGGAAAWPLAARAQQGERTRRIGVLMNFAADDAEGQSRVAELLQTLEQLGWRRGQNLRVEVRWGAGDMALYRKFASELAALAPDIMVASASSSVMALQQAAPSTPIVFVVVSDPLGAGFVDSLSRPGGNITGFTNYEYSMSTKWLELLKEIAPRVTRVAVLRNAGIAAGSGQYGALQAAATSSGMEMRPIDVRDPGDIERAIGTFARGVSDGLVVTGGGAAVHRRQIIALAARHQLPTVYPYRYFVTDGGLISYGPNLIDQYRRAAEYIDRIFKGERAGNLPVQAPTKFELVINLKTAKALGLEVPPMLLARADEVIE